MIVMRMCGGLGNQMFQYALGRRLSMDRKVPLLLDIAPFLSRGVHDVPRTYRLHFMNVTVPTSLNWQIDLGKAFPPGTHIQCMGIQEQSEALNANVFDCPKTAYLAGYWQTEKYFLSIADQIRADFALAAPLTPGRQATADLMAQSLSISVHVRRTDYLTHPGAAVVHGTCSPEWYDQAMRQMADTVEKPRFFVFSDEPQWARNNLPSYENMVFVDPQPDDREYEDMHLMARCKHHIIANSTFSWWGAWLNPSPQKKVIAPKRWFLKESDLSDRLPPEWITL
jgi:hypothetical protein